MNERTIVKCGDCSRPLVEISVVKSPTTIELVRKISYTTKVLVHCCYCRDGVSFWSKEIGGQINISPISPKIEYQTIDTEQSVNKDGLTCYSLVLKTRKI